MSMTAIMWSSSPSALGRPSSPLNPHTNVGPSSSPLTSPTPHHITPSAFTLGSPVSRNRPSHKPTQTRYTRPTVKRPPAVPFPSSPHFSGGGDLFGEGKGTTPVESAMWKERFARRVQDRERRMRIRAQDLDRRRSIDTSDDMDDEDEAERAAQADDEEVFRRLMVMQRRKAEHAAMVSYEVETGGSDPALPDFWEDDIQLLGQPSHSARFREQIEDEDEDDDMGMTPKRTNAFDSARPTSFGAMDEDEQWALEAAAAEEAEREAEDADIARRVEEAYGVSVPAPVGGDLDMDWGAFDAMDIE